jgi:hypothetical protein
LSDERCAFGERIEIATRIRYLFQQPDLIGSNALGCGSQELEDGFFQGPGGFEIGSSNKQKNENHGTNSIG